ncbi:hypothetical protein [Streptomyces globisporus]
MIHAHERFDLESSGAAVTYDASRGGFVFSWGGTAAPFRQETT